MTCTRALISMLVAGSVVYSPSPPQVVMAEWAPIGSSDSNGGISNSSGASRFGTVEVDGIGRPVVVWQEQTTQGASVYLRRWDGSNWMELGGSASGTGISGDGDTQLGGLAVAFDLEGNPIVAWSAARPSNVWEIQLRRWNGTAWAPLGSSASPGGISSATGSARGPSIAVDAAGYPWVAWNDQSTNSFMEIYLSRWNGSSWVEVSGSASGGGLSQSPSRLSFFPTLRFDGAGTAHVVWTEQKDSIPQDDGSNEANYDIYLKKWTGWAWVEVGGSATDLAISGSTLKSMDPSLAFDASGNPIIAWQEEVVQDAPPEIYVRRWNGSAWVGIGVSDSAGGISATLNHSKTPKVAIDLQGNPIVAWSEQMPGDSGYDVYLRRWNGSTWEELDSSASGGGVSDTADSNSFVYGLTVSPLGDIVTTWEERPLSTSNSEVYCRRFAAELGLSELRQMKIDGSAAIAPSGITMETAVKLGATLFSLDPQAQLRFQVEAQLVSEGFGGSPTLESPVAASGEAVTVDLSGLSLGGWHWRARVVDGTGKASPWLSYGPNPEGTPDFSVVPPAPSPPPPPVSNGGSSSSGCGLLGVEPVLLLLLLEGRGRSRTLRTRGA